MKYAIILSAILLLTNSCSNDKKDNDLTQDILFQMLVSATWEIDLFSTGDEIETSNFSGYSFSFTVGNTIRAFNGTNDYPGTWQAIKDNNPDSESGITLDINMTEPETFAALAKEWAVISATQEMIRLQFVNGGGLSTEFLTFGKK